MRRAACLRRQLLLSHLLAATDSVGSFLLDAVPRSFPIEGGSATTVCVSAGPGPPTLGDLRAAGAVLCSLFSGGTEYEDGSSVRYTYPQNEPLNFTVTRIVNGSCAVCEMPSVTVPGLCQLALGVAPGPHTNGSTPNGTVWSVSVRIAFFDSVETAFGLRPYIAERNGSLLLAPHRSLARLGSFSVALHFPFAISAAARIHEWKDLNATTAHHVLQFSLEGLPELANQDCLVHISFPIGLRLEKLRRFQRAPPLPEGSRVLPVQVDHTRKSLLIDGRTHHGVGWYMDFAVGANGAFWGFDDAQDLALRGMAPRGITQVMLYNFQFYPAAAQLEFLDRAAASGLKVMYEVDHDGWIKRHQGTLNRSTLSAQLDALAANISLVKEHPALL